MKKRNAKRFLSTAIAMTMAAEMLPVQSLISSASGYDDLVTSLARLYDGDEKMARDLLDDLRNAGIIDDEGNMVEVEIKENGITVSLDDITSRIAAGEDVGELTANDHEITAEKLMKMKELKTQLEIIKMLDEDVEITDEHVANLESLIKGISDGSIDIDEAIANGELSLKSSPKKMLSPASDSEFPSDNTGTGDIEVDADGKYTDKLISGSTYNENYKFTLTDTSRSAYYKDSSTEGIISDGVITLSCADTATAGGTVTVTAELNKKQALPVSFDWSAAAGSIGLTGTTSGTVTWAPGQTGSKTFTVNVAAKGEDDKWKGTHAFVIEVGNMKNANLAGEALAWSKVVTVSANDKNNMKIWYDQATVPGSSSKQGDYTASIGYKNKSANRTMYYSTSETINNMPNDSRVRLVFNLSGSLPETGQIYHYFKNPGALYDNDEQTVNYNGASVSMTITNPANTSKVLTFNRDASQGKSQFIKELTAAEVKDYINQGNSTIAANITYAFWHNNNMQHTEKSYSIMDCSDAANFVNNLPYISNVKLEAMPLASITDVSVPEGSYYSGQTVPVTVTFDHYVTASQAATLKINNVDCHPLESNGTITNKLTFAYTVKTVDTGAINASAISGVDGLDPGSNFSGYSFGKDQNVEVVSAVKQASIDYANVKWGISDEEPGEQEVTVLIPFKSGESTNWLAGENEDFTEANNGKSISLAVPGYENATSGNYLRGAYFSFDNGKTRYPVYIVDNGGTEGVALACRFNVPLNANPYTRLDTLNLFMDNTVGIESATTYLDTWDNAKTDEKGFVYFDGTGKAAAPIVVGTSYSYYAKGSILFNKTEYISRGLSNYTGKVANGYLNQGSQHILLNDAANPDHRYDVEIVANDMFYQAQTYGVRAEDNKTLTLSYQISNRKDFTFTKVKNFEWSSSDETIASVITDDNGIAHIELTGEPGNVEFTLKVKNGAEAKSYTLAAAKLTVLEGKTPFLNISKYSQNRQSLTYTDTDIAFASNMTARNGQVGMDTTFKVKLYKAITKGGTLVKTGDPIWTGDFISTLDEPLTHITVPGEELTEAGNYCVEISTEYYGGEVREKQTVAMNGLSATAFITAKQAPATIRLNKLSSYYVKAGEIPAITYTVSKGAEVKYTIQKSGESVEEKKTPESEGYIPFTDTDSVPDKLKESYTITVYARNSSRDAWSVDSMVLTVYNPDILDQIVADVTSGEIGGTTGGTGTGVKGRTIDMDNHGKIANYGVDEEGEYQLTFDDFTALRTDMSLQKIVSVNYGEAAYGLLSDKMQWESSDSSLVSVNYEQGGIYSDIRNYSYTSYAPATDFLLVGKGDTNGKAVTITATHAKTGISSSFDVESSTLKDQLYVFQFSPAIKTDVTYVNGKGEKRTLQSNEKGELAVYEPDGIDGTVMVMSKEGDKTYVGSLFQSDLATGERDIASLQLYPCNNLRLRAISDAQLNFLTPDGKPYTGQVTIRGGVYKNGTYCPDALMRVGSSSVQAQSGRSDIKATVTNGKLKITLDPTQFKTDPNSQEESGGAQPGDNITYVFEYSFGDTYRPGYVILNASTDIYGASSPADSIIQIRKNTGSDSQPQIISQKIQQYYGETPTAYTRNVIDYTDNIGISTRFSKEDLITDVALLDQAVGTDASGYTTYNGTSATSFSVYTPNNQKLTGQNDATETVAEQIIELNDLDDTALYVFPFSSVPIVRSIYKMTDTNLRTDGITDKGNEPTPTTPVKAMIVRDGVTVKSETLPFGVSNLSHQIDLSTKDGGAKEIGDEINTELKSQLDMGSIFGDIDVNDMLKNGFVFLSKLSAVTGETPINMMILPTEDPGRFRIVASVGYNKRDMKTDTNPSVDFDPDHLYDDMESFQKEMEELGKDDKKKGKDKDDEGDAGEGSVHINFYGTVILEAQIGIPGQKWGIDFCGGSVGTNFEAKYEWSQNFMCGPVPVTISFEVKGTADLEVSFANKEDARALLIDAAVGVSIEAFAGIGFDFSLVALRLGIFGKISANDNFLYLTTDNMTGNKLEIEGEIGIKLVVKALLITYEETFASTGFKWSKTWGDYDKIIETWKDQGYADLSGSTVGGKAFNMRLMSNGTAIVSVDGGNEIENRDYLVSNVRNWNAPKMLSAMREIPSDGMTELQSNAYPYSNPVLNNDGSIMLYISDNNNAEKPESVVCYAVKSENGYTDMGRVDTSEDNVLADSDAVVSGSGNNVFAAWVKQLDSPEKEMHDKATFDDLGMMINATEIYVGSYNGTSWTTERLTDNTVGDMSPTIASSGNRAIAAWRSLSATSMPEEGAGQDMTAMFDAENSLNYRYFDGNEWKEAEIAYNGASGTVNAVDSAMLPDGTAILVYSVRTTDDVTGSETFYTVIDNNGEVLTTGRLTNDNFTDTNAQVAAVGDQFVVGWYSEHNADEDTPSGETVVSHDIGLARINANGSVDADFPESLGGTSASSITSDFHFSAPDGCNDINDLSIVWSQQKASDDAEDSGKYQLNAVRFYEDNGVIGVTSQTNIAETAQNYIIDKFDTYTDENGAVNAVLIGSDYNNIDGISKYDTIDLTDLPIQAVNESGESSDLLTVLEQEPIASIKLAKGKFAETAIEAYADTDLTDLIPGLEQPVQFTVKNTGTDKINKIEANIAGQKTNFTGLNLMPGQSAVITMDYTVPETVSDVEYTLTADGSGTASGMLELNRPDIGISSMKIVREGDKTRDIQLMLANSTNIPLVGSKKTVKLAFYKDSEHKEQVGDTITIDPSAYQDIDDDIYTYRQTLNVSDFIGDALEIPEEGVRVYAYTWIDDVDEIYTSNNSAAVGFKGLITKYQSQITMDTALISEEDNEYTVVANISNNSLQSTDVGAITADILDSNNRVLASVDLTSSALTLEGEQVKMLSVKAPQLSETPANVSLRSAEKSVILDPGSGTCEVVSISLTTDNKPAGLLPEATRSGYHFDGWFTEPDGGEEITAESVLEGGDTIYAHYTFIPVQVEQDWTLTMDSYDYDGTAHKPVINGQIYGSVTYNYYNDDTGELLTSAPSKAGNYVVKVISEGNKNYYGRIQVAVYSILDPFSGNGMVNVDSFKENNVVPESDGKIFAGWFTDSICTKAYTEDSGKAYAKFIDEKILTVKAQISSGTTANSASTSIRFITSVDSLKYKNVGFKITFNGKTINQKMTKVYTAINANGKKVLPSVFSADSHYMEAYTLKNIPKSAYGEEFTVTPNYTTLDGTIVEGETKTFTIADMIK